jgi:hypothetical protein
LIRGFILGKAVRRRRGAAPAVEGKNAAAASQAAKARRLGFMRRSRLEESAWAEE